jgi:hypothetical protein
MGLGNAPHIREKMAYIIRHRPFAGGIPMAIRMTALLAALAFASGTAAAGGGGKIKWLNKYSQAVAEAKETGKPIVIFFSGEG